MGCIVVTVLSDTDVVQVFPESGEGSGGAHVRARWHHTYGVLVYGASCINEVT